MIQSIINSSTFQLSGCLTLLPILMLNSEQRDEPLGLRDYLGWGIWGLGFATEAIADQQKWFFKSDPDNAVSQLGGLRCFRDIDFL